MENITHICNYCRKEFSCRTSFLGKFCSIECSSKGRSKINNDGKSKRIEKICQNCGKKFMARIDKPGKFCSISCSTKRKGRVKSKGPKLICRECGKIITISRDRLKTFKYCSKECKCKNMPKGSQHHNWKGGGTKDRENNSKIKEWKEKVTELNGGKFCNSCGSIEWLEFHHIKEFSSNVDGRFDPLNGMILCNDCHSLQHPENKNFIKSNRRHKQ